MSKSSHSDQSNIEFSDLSPEQISNLAEDYLAEKQELEKSIKQIDIAKLIGVSSIVIGSLLASASFTPLVIGVGLAASTIDTESLAERLNELKKEFKRKRRIAEDR